MKASHHSVAPPPAGLFWLMVLMALLFALVPLALAGMADAYGAPLSGEEALLAGPRQGRCAGLTAQADYAGAVDAAGNPVEPAEGSQSAPPVQIPGETVLVERNGVEIPVRIDGLNKALASGDACGPAVKPAVKASQPRS